MHFSQHARGGVELFRGFREGGLKLFPERGPKFPNPPHPVIKDHTLSSVRLYDAMDANDFITDNVFRYAVEVNCWSKSPAEIPPLAHASATTLLGNIHITGGQSVLFDYRHPTGFNIAYNVSCENWDMKSEMNFARYQHISEVVRDRLYVAGGRDDFYEGSCNYIEAYDPVTDQWTIAFQAADLPVGLAEIPFGASVVQNKDCLHIIGGSPGSRKAIKYKIAANKVSAKHINLPETCERNVCALLTVQ